MFSRRSAVSAETNPFSQARQQLLQTHSNATDWTLSNPTRAQLDYSAFRRSARHPTEAGAEMQSWDTLGSHHCDGLARLSHEPDPLGHWDARVAISRAWHGAVPPPPEQLLLLPSTSQAYQFLFLLLCDPGDEVLVPEPSYPLLSHLAGYSDVRLRPYRLSYDGAWHLDTSSLEPGPGCRAIIVVHPNNPTGSYLSPEEWKAIDALGLPIISDEVFARYVLSAPPRVASAYGITSQLTFCLDGLSKSAGMPHAKLSWIATTGPQDLCREALRRLGFLADTFLPTTAIIQLAAEQILSSAEEFRSQLQARLQHNLRCLRRALDGSAASLLEPQGGWSFILRLPATNSDEEWCRLLMDEHHVILYPGYMFDIPGPPHAVGSLLLPPDACETACQRLRELLDRHAGG